MRRTYNAAADVPTSEYLEHTRRLLKGTMDIAKRLDEERSRALSVADLFTPSGEVLRVKLKDYCERLIFKDPLGHARKTEELVWRKGFYDVVHAAKKLRKGNAWSEVEKALISVHLAVGVGFYNHLILRLQLEYSLDLVGVIDFAFIQSMIGSSHGKNKNNQNKQHSEETKQCVIRLIHRSLVCLGDLARYKLELDPNWDPMIAKRYYKMAIAIDPNIGMPYNQLGTMAGNRNYGLDTVYYYIRCALCPEPFEGAEGNLRRAIANNCACIAEKSSVQHCVSKLLCLLQLWDYEVPNSDRINQECQDLLNDLENCLTIEQVKHDSSKVPENEDSIEAYLQSCKNEQTTYLTDDMLFKIVAICLMSISTLKTRESSEVHSVIAITLAVVSRLVQITIARLHEAIIDSNVPNAEENFRFIKSDKNAENETNIIRKNIENGLKAKNLLMTQKKMFAALEREQNESASSEKESAENNGNPHTDLCKMKDKAKSLLTKLRRRKRKNSSDSDVSDAEHGTIGSSSDEMNSDISETEDDVLSEEIVLSDDDVTDDNDDEPTCTETKQEVKDATVLANGKHIDDNTGKETETPNQLQNGDEPALDKEPTNTETDAKDSTTNSESATTVTTNVEASSTFDDSGSNTMVYIAQLQKESLRPDDILNILTGKEILASIKIFCDWLRSNQDILRICAKSSRTLLRRITVLLNLIHVDADVISQQWDESGTSLASAKKLKDAIKVVPLPEDIDLRGLNVLEEAHKSLDWKILCKYRMTEREEVLLRVLKLIEFGHYLSSVEESGVKYDQSGVFLATDKDASSNAKADKIYGNDLETDHSRGKLMRHMGRLWLKAEVRALETRLRSRLMSPYLVPDHEALAKHTPTLKRLVYAKKFIIVIPSVVVSALDEVKRISGRAREATRWLETQLRRGSRFLRAQRPHERLALPLIKGPKTKDKEAWLFFQIIECCHYLTQQTKAGLTNGDAEAPVVTLLTGCSPDDKKSLTFSPDGLAKTAGVNLEYIESFHTKWKASSKSHG